MGILFSVLVGTGVIAVGGAGVYAGFQFLTNFQPGSTKLQADLQKMKAELKTFIDALIPWDDEALELLSINHINQKAKSGIVTLARGVITSIYGEPMIAWAYKRYVSPNRNAIIYARSSHFEFIYRIRNENTDIHWNNEGIGTLKADSLLYNRQTGRLMARINKDPNESYFPVIIGDKEAASFINPGKATRSDSRAFEFLSDLEEKEEAVLLSLTIFEMIQSKLPEKKNTVYTL